MKLYYMPGACSLAVHIALLEIGLSFDLEKVDYKTRKIKGGQDFFAINPRGYVPALTTESGWVLTEVPVILQYLDCQAPAAGLLPQTQHERLQALEWLNFLATEIHKSFSPLFRSETPSAFLEPGRMHLCGRFSIIETALEKQNYAIGERVSATDAYLFTLCRWLPDQELSVARWPNLQKAYEALAGKSSIQAALKAETH